MQTRVRIFDEVFGAADPAARRVERPTLRLSAQDVTVANLIRFRIETERDRQEDGLLALAAPRPKAERALNAAPTLARSFANPRTPDLQSVDLDGAVAAATEAFEHGRFLILVNDRQITSLSEPIALSDVNEAVFLRLMPLQAG